MSGNARMTVSMDPSAIPLAMNSRPGMTHDGVPAGSRPTVLYAGRTGDPAHRRLDLRRQGRLGRLGTPGRGAAPSRTTSWSHRRVAARSFSLRSGPPPPGPSFGAEEVIAVLDGLVLTGGGDVDPASYGETAAPEVVGVEPAARRERAGAAGGGPEGRPARARHLPGLPDPQRRAWGHVAPAPPRRSSGTTIIAAPPSCSAK